VPNFRTGTVTAIKEERRGLQKIEVDGQPALVLTQLIGPVAVGDRVVINTTAVDLDLGTGGYHLVHWNLARESWENAGPGHIMKLRYTSLQADTGAAEDGLGQDLPDLGGVPVVACSVHSQVAAVVAAYAQSGGGRMVFVMTDGGALPLAHSDLIVRLTAEGLIAGTITAGHAFGGDLEAVTVPSALWLARDRFNADAVVVAPGPGLVGTGTPLGTTALDVVATLDAAAALNGRPILCVRASSADSRARHVGLSHHTRTALRMLRSRVEVPVPPELHVADDRHAVTTVEPPDVSGLAVTTMGRTPEDDPLYFRAAAAAGVAAARHR